MTGPGRDADSELQTGAAFGAEVAAPHARGRAGAAGPGRGSGNVRLTAWVEGRVQGVGFRWWVRSRALALGLVGEAENLADGRVKVIAEGPTGLCEELLGLLQAGGTPGRVRRVTSRWAPASGGFSGFFER